MAPVAWPGDSDAASETPTDRLNRMLLYLQDPSIEISAYPNRATYWMRTRNVHIVKGKSHYQHVPSEVDAAVRIMLSVTRPKTLKNSASIRDLLSRYIPDVDEKYQRLFNYIKRNEVGDFPNSGWDSTHMDPSPFDDATLSTYVCRAFDLWLKFKERRLPPNAWCVVYNAFFESFWEEEMKTLKDLRLTYSPIWALHDRRPEISDPPLDRSIEQFCIKPDAVFSVNVMGFNFEDARAIPGLSDNLRDIMSYAGPELCLASGDEFVPGMAFDLPILIVEHVKTLGHMYTGETEVREGVEQHEMHLAMAMMSAAGLFKTIGVSSPVFGLLVNRFRISVYVHFVPTESDLYKNIPDSVAGLGFKPEALFDLEYVRHTIRFRLFLQNVMKYAAVLRQAVDDAKPELLKKLADGTYHHWRLQELPDRSPSPIDPPSISDWSRKVEP